MRVRDLLKDLYEKACRQKHWGLVRHTAGMLGKRVEDLAKAVTDLLVHQKQITVGMVPYHEHTVTGPLPNSELRQLIHQVCPSLSSCSSFSSFPQSGWWNGPKSLGRSKFEKSPF